MSRQSEVAYADDTGMTGWVGWIGFAGVIMVTAGIFQATAGLVALVNDDVYVVVSDRLALTLDYTQRGWVHLIIGALVAAAGFLVFSGRVWARNRRCAAGGA